MVAPVGGLAAVLGAERRGAAATIAEPRERDARRTALDGRLGQRGVADLEVHALDAAAQGVGGDLGSAVQVPVPMSAAPIRTA